MLHFKNITSWYKIKYQNLKNDKIEERLFMGPGSEDENGDLSRYFDKNGFQILEIKKLYEYERNFLCQYFLD